ncbi:MAG: hypothetical protein C3F06_01670 [Candidatus Methanoperedenaceae archaeon]|nr:MAG: hypothetical protein C3F06_01670 [Candidatus Methanoperedenaceae archaeon]
MIKKILVTLFVIGIMTSGVSASKIDNQQKTDCGADENVHEELVGMTHDGKDFIVKRVMEFKVKQQNPGSSPSTSCYKLMGVKWASLPVTYSINPSNPQNVDAVTAINTGVGTWDEQTSKNLFAYSGTTSGQAGTYDGVNIISFGSVASSNTIAVTTTWYTRIGKRILETDMKFNTYYIWGTDGSSDKMDLQNIATHELGHTFGLSDLYNSCTSQTMYGYADFGETNKRTLESGDIAGLRSLYGT